MKHTPGPWKVVGQWIEGTREHSLSVVPMVAKVMTHTTDSVRDANARLIAAAPTMLKALQAMVDVFNAPDIDPLAAFVAVEQAKAAITQAEGTDNG